MTINKKDRHTGKRLGFWLSTDDADRFTASAKAAGLTQKAFLLSLLDADTNRKPECVDLNIDSTGQQILTGAGVNVVIDQLLCRKANLTKMLEGPSIDFDLMRTLVDEINDLELSAYILSNYTTKEKTQWHRKKTGI